MNKYVHKETGAIVLTDSVLSGAWELEKTTPAKRSTKKIDAEEIDAEETDADTE